MGLRITGAPAVRYLFIDIRRRERIEMKANAMNAMGCSFECSKSMFSLR
jgi:hypothetical protein